MKKEKVEKRIRVLGRRMAKELGPEELAHTAQGAGGGGFTSPFATFVPPFPPDAPCP